MADNDLSREMDEAVFNKFIKLVHKVTGITLSSSRKAMLQGRLRPRMRKLSIDMYAEYLDYIENHAEEVQNFIDMVTTNETYFYRTPRIWNYLEKDFVPRWIQDHPGETLHVWSAAASSGEEAHTLAIILHSIKIKHSSFKYQILGSDISNEILNFARTGEYIGRSIESFKNTRPDLFNPFMKKNESGTYSVLPEIRANINFQNHNLFEAPKKKNFFDLVLIRNVLIYFDIPDQERVLSNMSMSLKTTGQLIIGESESLTRLKTPFSFKMPLVYELARSGAA